MRSMNLFACGIALVAGAQLSSGVEAACVTNELDVEAQVQVGENWNEIINAGESKCAEGQGGLVSAWVAQEPGPDENLEADQGGVPSATGEVSADGTVKLEKGAVDSSLVVYDASGAEVSRELIADVPDESM